MSQLPPGDVLPRTRACGGRRPCVHSGSFSRPAPLRPVRSCHDTTARAGPCSRSCCEEQQRAASGNRAVEVVAWRQHALVSLSALLQGLLTQSAQAEEAVAALAEGAKYVPSPYEPGWEIWAGSIAAVIPFIIGSYEFGKRIIIQQRCELCGGRGLVPSTNAQSQYLRKCPQCGGFFPWVSWKLFLSSTAAPGNGGPLQQPKGQRSVFYEVPEAMPTKEQVIAAREKYMAQEEESRQQ